jgi:hypothetical protein
MRTMAVKAIHLVTRSWSQVDQKKLATAQVPKWNVA